MRQIEYLRQQRILREQTRQRLEDVTYKHFQTLWAQLRSKVRRLNATRPGVVRKYTITDDLWEMFTTRLHEALLKEIQSGAITLFMLNRAFYNWTLPEDYSFDSDAIALAYAPKLAERLTSVKVALQRLYARKVTRWYTTPGSTLQELIDKLSVDFNPNRARNLAITLTGEVNTAVQEATFAAVGIRKWWWMTMRDSLVCTRDMVGPDGQTYAGCRGLHGKIFDVGMVQPPDGSHGGGGWGCRCSGVGIISSITKAEDNPIIQAWDRLVKADFREDEHPKHVEKMGDET